MKPTLNILSLILVLVVNVLADALPFNGRTTGEVSAKYGNLFVPAGFTFSIWGLIYLLLIGFAVYQSRGLFRKEGKQEDYLAQIGPWFAISCLANALWLAAWHYEQLALSVLVMLALLSSLLVIYVKLQRSGASTGPGEKWLVRLPFSVYLGWVSIATIANVAAWLTALNWNGFGIAPDVWAGLMLIVGAALGLWMLQRRSDVPFALVVAWAFFGILSQRQAEGNASLFIFLPLIAGLASILTISVLRLRQWMAE
jgi:hypothetical protein